ncbi:MAG TPA: TIR domain-containing protein [Candidatus Methylomirabilis sp.]|nr:TIR domain-containing protein [Candidatus Methylomirabilis sp.]
MKNHEFPAEHTLGVEPRDLVDLPRLQKGQAVDLKAVRVPYERFYLGFVYAPAAILALAFVAIGLYEPITLVVVPGIAAFLYFLTWIAWRLTFAFLLGNSIRIGADQYPQIHRLIQQTSEILNIEPPTVLVLQGHGLFEVLVARRFSRRGVLIITSNMLDDLTKNRSSRELMFFIGRQLGLIATGYFRFWTIKHTIGQFSLLFYLAWLRHCHLTADRLGLLIAGDLDAAEQALVIITAGSGVAPGTSIEALKRQRSDLFDTVWAWIQLGLSAYPYMVDRILRLREFAYQAAKSGIQSNAPVGIGAIPIYHHSIRALPLMIVHGHDETARKDLENFLLTRFPHVSPVLMIDDQDGAMTLPEKFERLANGVSGALVLLTPDDSAVTKRTGAGGVRARQNVVLEIGWFWAKKGRNKVLLLARGDLEVPTDLSGAEVHRFSKAPTECSESIRAFIDMIEAS